MVRNGAQLNSPVPSHALLLGTHVVPGRGEPLPATSVVIPVLPTASPFPAPVPLSGKWKPTKLVNDTRALLRGQINKLKIMDVRRMKQITVLESEFKCD